MSLVKAIVNLKSGMLPNIGIAGGGDFDSCYFKGLASYFWRGIV